MKQRPISEAYTAFLVQQVQDAQLCFNQIDARLVVVKINHRPVDLLTHVLLLLQFENVLKRQKAKHGYSSFQERKQSTHTQPRTAITKQNCC